MGVVQQSVEDGVGDRGFTDPAVPVLDGQLRGDHGGTAVGTIVDEFEQVLAAVGLERLQREIVEDEAVELGKGEQPAFVRAVAARDAQFLEQPRQASVERAVTEAAGALRERTGESGLADAGGADDQHGLSALDPLAVSKAGDLGGLQGATGAGVAVLEAGLGVPESRLGQQALQAVRVAVSVLALDQQREAVLERERARGGQRELLLERPLMIRRRPSGNWTGLRGCVARRRVSPYGHSIRWRGRIGSCSRPCQAPSITFAASPIATCARSWPAIPCSTTPHWQFPGG